MRTASAERRAPERPAERAAMRGIEQSGPRKLQPGSAGRPPEPGHAGRQTCV